MDKGIEFGNASGRGNEIGSSDTASFLEKCL